MNVSVVIASRNRAEMLAQCVDALDQQNAAFPFEVVIVDDASTDGTSAMLKQLAAQSRRPIRVLRNQSQSGPAAARNRGWSVAKGECIAFTDDDCLPTSSWLGALSTALSKAAPQVAGVGGRVLPAEEGLVSRYMTFHRILEPPASLSYLVTANCIYRRSALEEVGGFDERVRSAGGEDPGLSHALSERGHVFGFEPDAVVKHRYREGLWDFAKTFYRYGRGCRLVLG